MSAAVSEAVESDTPFKIASDLHAAYEQLIYGLPKYLDAENLTDEENMIREAYITLDVTAHRLAALQEGSGALPASPSGGKWRTDFENLPKSGRALFYRPLAEATNDEVVAVKTIVNGLRDVCWGKTIPEGHTAFNPTDGMCHITHWMPLPDAPSVGNEK